MNSLLENQVFTDTLIDEIRKETIVLPPEELELEPTEEELELEPTGEELEAIAVEQFSSANASDKDAKVKISALIPSVLNEQIKTFARANNRFAAEVAGDLICRSAAKIVEWEVATEVARLREKFGDDFIEVLSKAA